MWDSYTTYIGGPNWGDNGPPEISFDSDINEIDIIGLYDKIRKIPKIS